MSGPIGSICVAAFSIGFATVNIASAQLVEKSSAWRINSHPLAMKLAAKEINYPVRENYIMSRKEDEGTEKVRIIRIEKSDYLKISPKSMKVSSEAISKFTQKIVLRGIDGIEIDKWDVNSRGQEYVIYRYQIQGSIEPLVISSYGFNRNGEVFLAIHMGSLENSRRYRTDVNDLVRRFIASEM
ncbi:MAG: hypothetical protein IPL83_02235 [Bdellovibrionales bacterium]|nr:hypothetical protein [Bdellovibrionales bacterium]